MASRFIDDAINESQTITYRQLSRELGLHVNAAKETLWQHMRQNQDQVSATYVVTGWKQPQVLELESRLSSEAESSLNDAEDFRSVQLVKDDDLDEQIKTFARVSTVHVYSLGPKGGANNETALEFSSQAVSKSNMRSSMSELREFGVIFNKHLSEQMISRRQENRKAVAATTSVAAVKPATFVKTETKKPNTIAGAFKASAKKEGNTSKPVEKKAVSTGKSEIKKKAGTTSKVDSQRKAQAEKLKREEQEKLKAQEKHLEDLFSDEGSDMDVDEKLQREEEEKARLDREAENELPPLDDVVMTDAPQEEQADEEHIAPEHVKGKKKIKKAVTTKTADGFLQTEMVDVWVTDDEGPAAAPKAPVASKPKAPVKSEKPAKKGPAGQKSLMSFFGKKK